MTHKVIIIGSGPAGYTAALYTSRANLKPIVFTGFTQEHLQGGQLMTTTDVENYPGFPDGIEGPELMELFEKQCVRFGTEIIQKEVTKVDFTSRPFKVWAGKEEYEAESIIVSTGATAKYLEAEGVEEFKNRGVTACATCDGAMPKYRDQIIGVMGGGDTAMEEALFLTNFGKEIHLFNRSEKFRASKVMLARAKKHKKIVIHENTVLEKCYGDEGFAGLKGITIRNVKTNDVSDFPLEGLFMAIGHKPNTELFEDVLDMEENGYLITKSDSSYTNIEGIFACGDVQDHVYRQAVTAAGTGCMAAIDAERYLAEKA